VVSENNRNIQKTFTLILEFLNNKSHGEAAIDFWLKLLKIYEYPEGFKDRVHLFYSQTYDQLRNEISRNQLKYLHLWNFRKQLKKKIRKEFESIGIAVITHNNEKDSLIVSSLESYDEYYKTYTDFNNADWFANLISEKGYNLELSSVPDEAWKKMKRDTRSQAMRFLKVGRTLSMLRSKTPDKNQSRKNEFVRDFSDILYKYQQTRAVYTKFRRILEEITIGTELDSIKELHLCIRLYKAYSQQVIIDDSNKIEVLYAFKDFFYSSPSPQNLQRVFCFFIIEYIRHFKAKSLRRCPYCKEFFIAKHSKRQRCYSTACGKVYERLKKRKQRELEPEIYS